MRTWENLLTVNGQSANVLLASCRSRSAAGLVSFDGEKTELIDTISGTALSSAQKSMMRLVCSPEDRDAPGELLVYDAAGVERYYRIDAVRAPLDVIWDGHYFVILSAAQNSLFWLTTAGHVARAVSLPGEPDSWHLSNLVLDQGELFVSAFGRFNRTREWEQHKGERCGIIFDPFTRSDVVTGLESPHHPKILDGHWLVCNAELRELLQISRDDTPAVERRIQLEKWTRGLTFSDHYVFVGESADGCLPDSVTGTALASIAILDRGTLSQIGRVSLPFEEIHDLLIVSNDLLQGVRQGIKSYRPGFAPGNHPRSAKNSTQSSQGWMPGDLLPKEGCRARVSLEIEPLLSPDSLLQRPCVVENLGPHSFAPAMPRPVVITYKWLHKESGRYLRAPSMATRLPAAVPPRGSVACSLRLRTPAAEGHYELQVSLFQRGNGFFGKIDPLNAFRKAIWIHRPGTATQ